MNTLLTLLALGVANPPPGPLACPAPLAARGDIKAGPPLVHTFELTHRGTSGLLCITKIEAGCGCLRQSITATRLQPGETAKLTLEVNTLTQPDGPNRWQAQISYTLDLPGNPPTSESGTQLLVVTANLSREVSVMPPQIGFSSTGAAAQTLTITDRRPKPLTVVKAVASSSHLTAEVALPAPGRPQTITVKLAADAPAGHRDETVVLLTDDPTYPEFRVPVRVLKRAPGDVIASPESVVVRFAPGQDEVSALVQLRTADGKPVSVASALSDFPAVMVKFSSGAGPVAAVRVTVAGPAAMQPGSCVVRVRLAEPSGQEVLIPVSWTGGSRK